MNTGTWSAVEQPITPEPGYPADGHSTLAPCNLDTAAAYCTRMDAERMLLQKYHFTAMGDMLGALAHQWRQPLNALAVMVQNIQDAAEYDDLTPELINSTVRTSMQQIQLMSKTIDHFREFFRTDLPNGWFHIVSAVEELTFLLESKFASHGVRLHFVSELSDADSMGCGRKSDLNQVLVNLLLNAYDAVVSQASGTYLGGDVTIRLRKVQGDLVVQVEDTGGGIPDALRDRIFEPYFTTKEQGKGIGMGLYIARTVVEQNMGGSILAINSDEGAVFVISLPVG